MKKILFAIFLIGVLLFSVVSCGQQGKTVTVDGIVKLFDSDDDYYVQHYTAELIDKARTNMTNANLDLKGDISEIVHIIDQSKSPENSAGEWTYIYDFTDEADAIAFAENRQVFIDKLEEDGTCIRRGRIVVFGTSSIISSIGE